MPKRIRQDPDHAVPVRVEVVPRRGLNDRRRPIRWGPAPPSLMNLSAKGRCPRLSGSARAGSGICASSMLLLIS